MSKAAQREIFWRATGRDRLRHVGNACGKLTTRDRAIGGRNGALRHTKRAANSGYHGNVWAVSSAPNGLLSLFAKMLLTF